MKASHAVKIALVAIIAGAVVAVLVSPLRHQLTLAHARAWVTSERAHVQSLWWTPLALIAAYGIGCIFAIPATLFIAVAGALWGWKLGLAYAIAGGMLGASASYFLGRFLGEGLIERFGKAGAAVTRQIKRAGFQTMLIVRLIPGPPFAIWNFAAGVARMRFRDYALATFIGLIPSHIIFAYCADSLVNGTMSEGDALKRLAIVCGLLIALILIPLVIKRLVVKRVEPVIPSS